MQTLPVHLDLFALIILLGIAQGLFLGVFFLTGERGRNVANRCLGWFMLALAAVTSEIFLCYTNYMFRLLELVDFSEPVNFTVGPLFFFYVFARLHGRLPRRWGWHLLPLGIWMVNALTWFYQPIEFKYDSYVDSYHPELPFVPTQHYLTEDFTGLRDYVSELTMLSCLVYIILALIEIRRTYSRQGLSWRQSAPARLAQLRNLTLLNLSFPILIGLVKPQFYEDLGDYILACHVTALIYVLSFLVMRGSDFYKVEEPLESRREPVPVEPESPAEPRKKYEKSALSEEVEEAVLAKLNRLLESDKPFLQPDLSLPRLAQQLNTSPHHLSQLLNDRLGQSFFDWLATHRIAEAQRLLRDPATTNLKIDEIAERVGYNSPSAFHTAFKRLIGQTPAQYREAAGTGSATPEPAEAASSRSARTS
ncbi:helix-turn-helix transcriptional regulator [Spirosoma taeanense]|uniref:Helix-turn-helix transcriptional regulator n=1 Tax=Spirosoma taeanense TaxID=2735870 RepID=A0A6M5Y608_9BACT|nr:helix-turn-helix transcriptional regulator [Spirosoma taeanense]QJW89309.1 helix-turn-helix transcriptional regulator [Spirosoma taeanense]